MNKKWLLVTMLVPLSAWSPWLTDELLTCIIYSKLGGANADFNCLGEKMPVKDVPVNVEWIPFGRAVYFPSEAMWVVTFFGLVI